MRSPMKKPAHKGCSSTSRAMKYVTGDSFYGRNEPLKRSVNSQRWNLDESVEFYRCYMEFGRNWERISEFIQTRSLVQVVSHSQKIQKSLSQAVYNTIQENRLKFEAQEGSNTRIKTRRNTRTVFSQIKVQEIISNPRNKELIHQEICKRIRDLEKRKNQQQSIDNFRKQNVKALGGTEEEQASKGQEIQFQLQHVLPGSLHLAFFPYFTSFYSPYSYHNIATFSPTIDFVTTDSTIKQQYTGEQVNEFPLIHFVDRSEVLESRNEAINMWGNFTNYDLKVDEVDEAKKMEKNRKIHGKIEEKQHP